MVPVFNAYGCLKNGKNNTIFLKQKTRLKKNSINGKLWVYVLNTHLKNEKNSVSLVSHENCDL